MVKLGSILNRLNPVKILVAGDLLVDSYIVGKAKRISPEAPVAIVNVQSENHLPGGAGNVVLNLLSLGATAAVLGRVGDDWAGQLLLDSLHKEGVDTQMVAVQKDYITPIKSRVIADHQQIVRFDREEIKPLCPFLEKSLLDSLSSLLDQFKLIALSDYGKGFLTDSFLSGLIKLANQKGIPVITDPKGIDYKKYSGSTIVKPNLSEAYAAANLSRETPLEKVASSILAQCKSELLMITRSEEGISLFDNSGKRSDFPVIAKEVKDVTGAGDTVLAMLAHSHANGLSHAESAELCNAAASLAIEHVGCARITQSDLAQRLFEQKMDCKVFDDNHLLVLKELLKKKDYVLLILPHDVAVMPSLFQAIKQAKISSKELLICMDGMLKDETILEILSSLQEVSFIVHRLESLKELDFTLPLHTYSFYNQNLKKI